MELKIKFLKWSAGLPVAMLNEDTAEELGLKAKDRILIKTTSGRLREVSTIIDTVEDLIKRNEIAVSSEIKNILHLKSGQNVSVRLAPHSRSINFIKNKLDGKKFTNRQIKIIIKDIVRNSLSEAEIALFVAAMYSKGMDQEELVNLIRAILKTGNTLKIRKRFVVDKHCIGGIPGNRTTPLVVSICAAAGLTVPKNSSRAITSAAGTADVIEAIARIDFSPNEIKRIVKKTGACMVWGGGLGMVPADAKIIQIEKVLKIDPEAQLLASILSKKLAADSDYILIDIPYGKNAKVSREKAIQLKKKFEFLGRRFHKDLQCILTEGSQPIGNGVGPILELIDVIKILSPKEQGPKDLEKKGLMLAGRLLEMTKKSKPGEGIKLAKDILYSGKAFEKFKEIISAQEGHLNNLNPAKFRKDILAKSSGKIKEMDNKKINCLARVAGCPVDKSSGLYLYHHVDDRVRKGDKLLTIYAETPTKLTDAVKFYESEKPILMK